MKRPFLVAAVLLLPLLVACAGGGDGPAPARPAGGAAGPSAPQQLTVSAMDTMRFDPPTLTVRAGQPIQLTLSNTGQLVHDFAMRDGVPQPITIIAQPGRQASGTFTIERPGTYTYYCSEPGHEQAGMKGVLTVR